MSVKIRIRRGVIHLVINNGHVRQEITTGLHTSSVKLQNDEVMRLAEILRSKKELQLISQMNGLEAGPVSKMTLYEYCEQIANKDRDTQIYKCLPYLERFGGKKVLLVQVSSRWLDDLRLKFETESGLGSKHTQAKYYGMIKQCLKKAYRNSLIQKDPTDGARGIRTPGSNKEALTIEEVKTLIKTGYKRPIMPESLQEEIRKAFIVGVYTGLRISDICELTYRQLDQGRNVIIKKMEKTDEYIYIPIHPNLSEIIQFKDSDELVFPELAENSTRTKLSTSNRYLSAWGERAGIKKHITWHIARHTNATLLIECGSDLYTVQKLLGHTHIATTMQYAKVSDKKKIEAVESLPNMLSDA